MSDSKSLGRKGEDQAAEYLLGKGYRIRNRNWVSGRNEVDIIAENHEYIVFVEVKTRSEGPVDDPRKSITREKRSSMIYTAENYVRRFNISKECRFDVIIIEGEGEGFRLEHIEYAFYPTLK